MPLFCPHGNMGLWQQCQDGLHYLQNHLIASLKNWRDVTLLFPRQQGPLMAMTGWLVPPAVPAHSPPWKTGTVTSLYCSHSNLGLWWQYQDGMHYSGTTSLSSLRNRSRDRPLHVPMATAWQLPAFHCLYNNLITFSTTYHYFLQQKTSIPFSYSESIKAETCCRTSTYMFRTVPKKTLDNTYGRMFLASAVMTKSAASDVSHVEAADWLLRFSNIWSRTGHCFKEGVKSWWYPSAELVQCSLDPANWHFKWQMTGGFWSKTKCSHSVMLLIWVGCYGSSLGH